MEGSTADVSDAAARQKLIEAVRAIVDVWGSALCVPFDVQPITNFLPQERPSTSHPSVPFPPRQVSGLFEGKLHILVNNVGTNIRKPTVEYSEAEYDSIMNTNLKSVYNLCQLAHPLLKAAAPDVHGGATLINIGSVAGVTAIKSGA